MIQKFRKKNSYKIYRCCSNYAIEYVVPSVFGEYIRQIVDVNHKRFLDLDTWIIKKHAICLCFLILKNKVGGL